MDRQKKIAHSFFESKEDYYFQVINNQLKYGKIFLKPRFVSAFECLFGILNTIPYFIDWVINNKKINIPENTIFVYRNPNWTNHEGLTWTQILKIEGYSSIRWAYSNGKVIEINDNKVSQ